MPFAAELRESLEFRHTRVQAELTAGQDLEQVLSRDLLTVEAMAEGELITSILLLSADGKRLSHGAAPRLPRSYRDAVDGAEIGPSAGSCGTAAHFNRPVYVPDIATDPLWAEWRDIALPLGLRSCWSTPIRGSSGEVLGTFAIYRRTVGDPTREEIESIDLIAEHVAQAIILARGTARGGAAHRQPPKLMLVADNKPDPDRAGDPRERMLELAARLEAKAGELEKLADRVSSDDVEALKGTSRLSRNLVEVIRRNLSDPDEQR